jgi:hypothetical protein
VVSLYLIILRYFDFVCTCVAAAFYIVSGREDGTFSRMWERGSGGEE